MSPTAIELDGFDVSADDVIAVARQGASVALSQPPASVSSNVGGTSSTSRHPQTPSTE